MTPTEAAFLLWHHSLASAAKRAEIEGLGAVQIIVAGLANEGAGVAVKAACLGLLRSLAKDDNACQTLATMKIDKFSDQPMPLCLVLEFLESSEAAQEAALETFRELAVRSGPKAVLMKKAADIPWRRLVNLLPNLSPKLCATLCGTLRALTAGKPDLRAKLVALGAVGRLCKIMGGELEDQHLEDPADLLSKLLEAAPQRGDLLGPGLVDTLLGLLKTMTIPPDARPGDEGYEDGFRLETKLHLVHCLYSLVDTRRGVEVLTACGAVAQLVNLFHYCVAQVEADGAGGAGKKAKKGKKGGGGMPPVMETTILHLTGCLRHLAIDDSNKVLIMGLDGIPLLNKMYTAAKAKIRANVRAILGELGMIAECRERMMRENTPDVLCGLCQTPMTLASVPRRPETAPSEITAASLKRVRSEKAM